MLLSFFLVLTHQPQQMVSNEGIYLLTETQRIECIPCAKNPDLAQMFPVLLASLTKARKMLNETAKERLGGYLISDECLLAGFEFNQQWELFETVNDLYIQHSNGEGAWALLPQEIIDHIWNTEFNLAMEAQENFDIACE